MAIGEFCQTGSGGTPSRKQLERYYGGNIPWVKSGELREGTILETEETITDVALKETSAKLIPANALLVAMYGATIGRVAVLGIEASSNQAVCHIIPDDKVADRRYLFYALRQNVPVWLNRGVGGAQPNISQQIIRTTSIPLPPPRRTKAHSGDIG
jgi:type I restriction enzyme, S subunit